ncbi:hypothetical protein DH2020_015340 [Rehmannia glutinosa]|uniref:Uncharacterized protein n=1 Tax=Rehmannia glutinosa TaxID=99300 RepID=A0ABR0WTZ7_REHGL
MMLMILHQQQEILQAVKANKSEKTEEKEMPPENPFKAQPKNFKNIFGEIASCVTIADIINFEPTSNKLTLVVLLKNARFFMRSPFPETIKVGSFSRAAHFTASSSSSSRDECEKTSITMFLHIFECFRELQVQIRTHPAPRGSPRTDDSNQDFKDIQASEKLCCI